MFGIAVAATILVILLIAWAASHAKDNALRTAPNGSIRVEALKAGHVNNTVAQYTRAGWHPTDQTTAKSLGSQARVTITFRKG